MRRLLLGLALSVTMATAAHAADITGKWSAGGKSVFTFKQQGDEFTGQVTYQDKIFKIVDGKVDGDKLSFYVLHDAADDPEVVDNGGKAFRNTAMGTVTGDEMTFSGSREGHPDIRAYKATIYKLAD